MATTILYSRDTFLLINHHFLEISFCSCIKFSVLLINKRAHCNFVPPCGESFFHVGFSPGRYVDRTCMRASCRFLMDGISPFGHVTFLFYFPRAIRKECVLVFVFLGFFLPPFHSFFLFLGFFKLGFQKIVDQHPKRESHGQSTVRVTCPRARPLIGQPV